MRAENLPTKPGQDGKPGGEQPRTPPRGARSTARTTTPTSNTWARSGRASAGTCRSSTPIEPDAELLEPSPRVVSRELLTRETLHPATTLNVLAAAWLQFEVHDWFSHGKHEAENPWEVGLADDDPWPERPMRIPRTRRDPTSDATPRRRRPSSPTTATGGTARRSTAATAFAEADPRRRGRQAAPRRGRPAPPPTSSARRPRPASPATSGSARRCCTRSSCASTTPSATGCTRATRPGGRRPAVRQGPADQCRADGEDPHRRVDAAIIAHPTTAVRDARELVGAARRARRQALRPALTSEVERHPRLADRPPRRPYSLTEEFVAVYRMHPLIPDEYVFRSP